MTPMGDKDDAIDRTARHEASRSHPV